MQVLVMETPGTLVLFCMRGIVGVPVFPGQQRLPIAMRWAIRASPSLAVGKSRSRLQGHWALLSGLHVLLGTSAAREHQVSLCC